MLTDTSSQLPLHVCKKRPTFGVVFGECWPFWCLHGAFGTPSALTSTCINCAVACRRLRQKPRPATASGVGRTATDSRLQFGSVAISIDCEHAWSSLTQHFSFIDLPSPFRAYSFPQAYSFLTNAPRWSSLKYVTCFASNAAGS